MAAPALLTPLPSCAGLQVEFNGAGSLWRTLKCPKLKGTRLRVNTRASIRVAEPGRQHGQQRSRVVTKAVPVAVSAAVTLVVVGAAVVSILRKEKLPVLPEISRVECEECKGSGICPECNGDGFLMKNLSKDAAAKARASAKDAATRYTAGLAKKWSYCATCSGGRGCPNCEGRGWLSEK